MNTLISRRALLESAALVGASGALSSGQSLAEPIQKASAVQPRLFPGCCAYSYGTYLQNGRMTMEDFIRKSVESGVHGVDMTVYWLKSTEPDYLLSLRNLAFRNGLPFSGTAIGANMMEPDAGKRIKTL